jgi:hypothetical protein
MRDQHLRPPRARSARNLSPRVDFESLSESNPLLPVQTASLGRILRVKEIAELFQQSPETVKRRLRERKLHGFKLGKAWYVREADLQCDIRHAVESDRHLRREEEQ